MRFKADEIVSVLVNEINQYESKLDTREVGRVLEVGDGIARVYGLSGVMAGEMVEFTKTKVRGVAFNLDVTLNPNHQMSDKFGPIPITQSSSIFTANPTTGLPGSIRNINRNNNGSAAKFFDFALRCFQAICPACQQGDPRAMPRKLAHSCAPDPCRCARDYDNFRQVTHRRHIFVQANCRKVRAVPH